MMLPINFAASTVAALAYWGIGMLWYSPLMFGAQYQKLSGISAKKADMKKSMARMVVVSLAASFIAAVVLGLLMDMTVSTTMIEALMLAIWVWLGFVATILVNGVLYEQKPWSLYIIHTGYQLMGFLAMGAVLALWP
jgi:hypothetical protein